MSLISIDSRQQTRRFLNNSLSDSVRLCQSSAGSRKLHYVKIRISRFEILISIRTELIRSRWHFLWPVSAPIRVFRLESRCKGASRRILSLVKTLLVEALHKSSSGPLNTEGITNSNCAKVCRTFLRFARRLGLAPMPPMAPMDFLDDDHSSESHAPENSKELPFSSIELVSSSESRLMKCLALCKIITERVCRASAAKEIVLRMKLLRVSNEGLPNEGLSNRSLSNSKSHVVA